VRSPDSSGGAAPQIESPQNRHLDLLVWYSIVMLT
jgi:hypothetical protein